MSVFVIDNKWLLEVTIEPTDRQIETFCKIVITATTENKTIFSQFLP